MVTLVSDKKVELGSPVLKIEIAAVALSVRILRAIAKFRQGRLSLTLVQRIKLTSDASDRGDVPGWVLVVLMTTGLITGIWTVAAPRLSAILTHSLDSMNNIR